MNKKHSILILEDNVDLAEMYLDILSKEYAINVISTLRELEEMRLRNRLFCYNLFIADLHLPDGNFLSWLQVHRKALTTLPLIIVSNYVEERTLKSSFDLGATDYITKPFHASVLKVKAEFLLKYSNLEIGRYIDGDTQDRLTSMESKLFNLLAKEKTFIDRQTLKRMVWSDVQVADKTIDVHLSNLRKKLLFSPYDIESKEKEGWRLFRRDSF